MRMHPWNPVPGERSYGIAIHNYQEVGEFRIKLTVGECVRILQECEDWYYGYATKNKLVLGIFPRSFIHIMDPSHKDTACGTYTYGSQSNIPSEVTSVLREWGAIWKKLYISNNPHFKTIENKMHELIRLRCKILSGTLPVDELKEVKRLVTWYIDVGNKILGLDMVVRDDQGNILNPDSTSVIELYRHHEIATQRIMTPACEIQNNVSQPVASQSHTYTFYLSVRKLICKPMEDIELLITLYDQKSSKPFSENYVIRCTREMVQSDADKYHNFRALFIDLGIRDLNLEKVYLVCYVIRNGAMEADTNNKNNSKTSINDMYSVRRPYAVACMNLSPYFKNAIESDEDRNHFLPLLLCEKDTLDNTLKKCFNQRDFPFKDNRQGVVVNFKLLQADLKQVREENPHLVFGNIAVVRKMGFPEVILPGDVRNDLYLTLINGEFSKGTNKSSDKNIEVVVTVCNEKGVPLQGGIILGSGIEPQTEYHSVVYYHEDKPKWYETLRVVVAIEDFKGCHLKFLFKHRSSKNDSKEKNEKPFAMAFVRLMQENGTTLKDEVHDLLVYKVDPKKYEPIDIVYLELASTRTELLEGARTTMPGLTLCNKDTFFIQTKVCSTKLTQNVDLLGLLNWTSDPSRITLNLSSLMKVDGEEVVKFLQDVLDTLFNILMLNSDSNHDIKVFECLLYVIDLILDRKYQHFQPVLDVYIQESFSATLAYEKLVITLEEYVRNVANVQNVTSYEKDIMMKIMKSLTYIMRFITRSRYLFAQLYEGKELEKFEESMTSLLRSFADMMCHKTDASLLIQAACLKYLPPTIPDILTVFSPIKLSSLLMELINGLPPNRLTKQKMMTIDDIIHSPLFLIPDCRRVLLSQILCLVKHLLENSDEGIMSAEHRRNKSKSVAKIAKVLGASGFEIQPPDENISQLELCIKILSDVMDLLFKSESNATFVDVKEIMLIILRTVIQTTIQMDRESSLAGNLASIMISIYRQMSPQHFEAYINHFVTRSDLLDFLMEILMVFKDLISRPVYPTDWCEMILLQNSVILKSLRFFSHTIRDFFTLEFEYQVWNNFFHCAVSFLTQPALQLETFSHSKRWRITTRYKDMRRIAGHEIRIMWFNLGTFTRQNKSKFVPHLVSPFLEMTLIPEEELRKLTIPIFFDMMQSEFYSYRDILGDKKDTNKIKYNFSEFENEMIAKLDNLVEGGSGDEQYKTLFHTIMMNLSENHTNMKEQGVRFVSVVTRLMERLLEYRRIINDESKENRMICTVNLLDFYNEINRKEMYIRYVNKLCALHLECENYTEAAYTLRLHSKLLSWSDTELSPLLRSPKYPHCETHRQLKEALYQEMIAFFDKGKMWECAVCICKELVRQYEEETFDYDKLSALLKRMSQFYDCIVRQDRPNPEYFRVGYYGKGFPSFLSNKVFVHRGKEYDRLSDFCSRMMNQYPNAEQMTKLTPPGNDILESPGQHLQINHVEPIMDERKQKLFNKQINERILRYHRKNSIYKFQYSRPYYSKDGDGDDDNSFGNLWLERTVLEISAPLPGILRWFPVVASETYHISPLRNAIETMQNSNKKLRELVISYKNDATLPLNPLSLKLTGIVDAAVMGGVNNYEKAFFIPEYVEKHPEDVDLINTLKDLIASQIPLLDIGIQIHGQRAPQSLGGLQKRMEEQFNDMKIRIEDKYGKKVSDIKFENIKFRRRTTTGHSLSAYNNEDRLSQASIGSVEGRSLRSIVSLPSPFSSTPTLYRSHNTAKASLSATSLSTSLAMFAAPVLSNSSSVTPTQKFGTISSLAKREKKDKKKRRNRTESKISLETDSYYSRDSGCSGNSQWYTTPNSDADSMSLSSFNSSILQTSTVDLQDTRSLKLGRSDSEKGKTSRPSSDSSLTLLEATSGMLSPMNRDSFDVSLVWSNLYDRVVLGTNTDSTTTSEDDRVPPPLPAKHREVEYTTSNPALQMANNDVTNAATPVAGLADTPPSPPLRRDSNSTPPFHKLIEKFQSQQPDVKSPTAVDPGADEQPPTPPPKKPLHRLNHTLV
ncbi:dedicator of cytokinesis protein 2 isoform X3 [Planococcus citri]|uniref:dedicator of cytokinesis protein 2 isoform X3 n=1 Tax=Planococcus citri TaxID=170843 RepID=UPI0031FA3368